MNTLQHITSKTIQVMGIGGIAVLLGISIPFQPLFAIMVIGFFLMLVYMKVVLTDYHLILGIIILIMPFNFESLIKAINIPFVNPFNLFWISYVGVVLLRSAIYSEKLIVKSPLNIPVMLVIISFTISFIQAIFVADPYHLKNHIFPTFQQWLQWILFYLFCLKGIRNEKEAKQVVIWVMLMVLLAGIQNIRDYVNMAFSTSSPHLQRATGLFGNANASAAFFCLYLPIPIALALNRLKAFKLKLLFSITSIIGLIAIVVTFSRTGMVSILLAGLIIATLVKINPKIVVILLVFLILGASNDKIRKRFSETNVKGPYGTAIDPSGEARLIAWQKGFHLIKERPVIGNGFFTFRYIHVAKYEDMAAKAHGSGGMAVHNGFINILVNAGITGLLSFLFLMGSALKVTWQLYRTTDDKFWSGVGLGMFAGIIAFLLANMASTNFYDRQMVGYLWILLAAITQGKHFLAEKQSKASL
jgi:O-antigen ligase